MHVQIIHTYMDVRYTYICKNDLHYSMNGNNPITIDDVVFFLFIEMTEKR